MWEDAQLLSRDSRQPEQNDQGNSTSIYSSGVPQVERGGGSLIFERRSGWKGRRRFGESKTAFFMNVESGGEPLYIH